MRTTLLRVIDLGTRRQALPPNLALPKAPLTLTLSKAAAWNHLTAAGSHISDAAVNAAKQVGHNEEDGVVDGIKAKPHLFGHNRP